MTDQPTDQPTRLTQEEAAAALTAAAWTETPGLDGAAPRLLDAVRAIRALCQSPDGTDLPANAPLTAGAVRAALTQALGDDPLPEERRGIHCYMAGLGSDWILEDALALLDEARDIAWLDNPLAHDLTVLDADGTIHRFAATKPGKARDE